ncbi:hypothetical protein [Kitasatospora sp. NPDC005856]|uniref:hypothetical protein n=1 Tax=Kitasatospora sp. NPDC005856 TaxID=3154566 RepID=UPI003404198C
MTQRRYEYAPAGSLPGLLQRGRGLGARMAAEDPSSATGLVLGCIRWDWRWDAQVDHRHLYLTRLVRDLDLEGTILPRDGERACDNDVTTATRPLPDLLDALEQHWVDQAWCGPAALARQLAEYGPEAAAAASLLRRFWLHTPHSYERAAYLEALAEVAPTGLGEIHVECLWDCEPNSRLLGIEHAPDRPEVRQRLAYLRDDPMEEPAVRAAARERGQRPGMRPLR